MVSVESTIDELALAIDRPSILSIERLLATQAEQYATAPALHFAGGAPITYRQLHQQVVEIGRSLRSVGIGSNDRVAIVHPNGPGMAVAFLGVASAATCAPLNPTYAAAEFEFYLEDLDARAVIVPSNWDSPVLDVARKRGIRVIELADRLADGERGFALDVGSGGTPSSEGASSPDAIALILHTSGTTARPKMIRLSQANLCTSAFNIRSTLQLSEADRCMNVMPLFHIHGLIGALLSSLSAGASVVCTPGFTPVHFYEWLAEFRPTWYSAVPSMHQEVVARASANAETIATSQLRFIRSSSAALSPLLMSQLEQTFNVPVIQAFGMTEASHQIASNPLPPRERKPGSVGLGNCEVAILDDQDQSLPAGVSGEIAIRGPNVTTVRPSSGTDAVPRGPDEWFRTGDVGYLDADGYLFISGRIKEIINRGGEKIAPSEIDNVLLEHPAVGQAVTCAVPDARLGEDIVAVVVRRPGKTLSERELREFASTKIAAFKVPRRVMFVEQIPKGPTGKIQRIGLAKKLGIESLAFAQPQGSVQFAAPQTPTEVAMAEVWSEVLGIDRVGLQDNFFELGGDSMAAADAIARIESRLAVTINIRDMGFGTLQQVAAGCENAASNSANKQPTGAVAGWMRKVMTGFRREA